MVEGTSKSTAYVCIGRGDTHAHSMLVDLAREGRPQGESEALRLQLHRPGENGQPHRAGGHHSGEVVIEGTHVPPVPSIEHCQTQQYSSITGGNFGGYPARCVR